MLVNDSVNTQGMVYLHKSVFQSHGYLSSAKCHVDSRWVLKISGFSLHPFRTDFRSDEVDKYCSQYLLAKYPSISVDDYHDLAPKTQNRKTEKQNFRYIQ